ncbi:hypothetical protein AM1_E0090 (plasmid) [Acaryochloris marina MBIC11017]|uniref:Uncharacterized protein n=1 Tax=Acaryochloris marina (strain MBIC 11017) TaxID=329726 RepID=A8ZPC3_ACAM1|nr:hypothetical protein AM1_E0090 [Acaryochloris marina MBIC11017]
MKQFIYAYLAANCTPAIVKASCNALDLIYELGQHILEGCVFKDGLYPKVTI